MPLSLIATPSSVLVGGPLSYSSSSYLQDRTYHILIIGVGEHVVKASIAIFSVAECKQALQRCVRDVPQLGSLGDCVLSSALPGSWFWPVTLGDERAGDHEPGALSMDQQRSGCAQAPVGPYLPSQSMMSNYRCRLLVQQNVRIMTLIPRHQGNPKRQAYVP